MGTALFKDAKSADDFSLVISKFKLAAELAPQWPEARYNLAMAKEAAGDYSGAAADLRTYQQFKLSDEEARKVQDKIYALEAKQEMAAQSAAKKAAQEAEANAAAQRAKQELAERKHMELRNLQDAAAKACNVDRDYGKTLEIERRIVAEASPDELDVLIPAYKGLGFLYDKGKGVDQNRFESFKWYLKAAELGDADAQNEVGLDYGYGSGVLPDFAESVRWYRKAAEQGNAHAMNNLGIAYEHGSGVPQDRNEAIKWYRKAAEKGDEQAKENLRSLE